MASVTTEKLYTPEDLLTMPDGDQYELVDGRLRERNMSFWSSYVGGRIYRIVDGYCEGHQLGWVVPEGTTYQCFPDAPSMVRKADVSFIRLSRMTLAQATEEGHCPIAPDLAVEVLSPNDNAYDVDQKVQLYLRAGSNLVWVVNPEQRTVEIHRQNGSGTILRVSDTITGEDVIPGFSCPVAEFFVPPSGTALTNGTGTEDR